MRLEDRKLRDVKPVPFQIKSCLVCLNQFISALFFLLNDFEIQAMLTTASMSLCP